MRCRCTLWKVLCGIALLWPGVSLADEADDLLSEMASSLKSRHYSGLVTYGYGDQWHSAKIQQGPANQQMSLRIDYLTGERRSQIRSGNEVVCIHQGVHLPGMTPDILKPFNSYFPIHSDTFEQHYRVQRADRLDQRIAGRDSAALRIAPTTPDRYGYRLWLDSETALPLKADILNSKNDVLQRFQFAAIDVSAAPAPERFQQGQTGHTVQLHRHLTDSEQIRALESEWYPDWLPLGFTLQRYSQSRDAQVSVKSERMKFSDGLASFTFFVDAVSEQHSGNLSARMSRQWGPVSATVEDVVHSDGKLRLTVVGELPPATLERILLSALPDQSPAMTESLGTRPILSQR